MTFYDEDNKKIKCNQNDLLELTLWHILKKLTCKYTRIFHQSVAFHGLRMPIKMSTCHAHDTLDNLLVDCPSIQLSSGKLQLYISLVNKQHSNVSVAMYLWPHTMTNVICWDFLHSKVMLAQSMSHNQRETFALTIIKSIFFDLFISRHTTA